VSVSRSRPPPQTILSDVVLFPVTVLSATIMHGMGGAPAGSVTSFLADDDVVSVGCEKSIIVRLTRWYSATRNDQGQVGEPAIEDDDDDDDVSKLVSATARDMALARSPLGEVITDDDCSLPQDDR